MPATISSTSLPASASVMPFSSSSNRAQPLRKTAVGTNCSLAGMLRLRPGAGATHADCAARASPEPAA
eukprot:3505950-Alexandrium_andersonii.AAC.1